MICEKCGTPAAPGDMFCGECGNKLVLADEKEITSGRICRTCGSPMDPGDMFCGECGSPYMNPTPAVSEIKEEEPRFCSECGRRLDPGEAVCHICAILNEHINSDIAVGTPYDPPRPTPTPVRADTETSFAGLKSTMKAPKEHKENEMELKRTASKFFKKPGEI